MGEENYEKMLWQQRLLEISDGSESSTSLWLAEIKCV